MSSWKWFWLSVLGGGIAFWIPDVIIPALNPNEQGMAVTIACPAALILFYAVMLRARRAERSGPSTAVFVIVGMWVLASVFMMLAQTARGSGFRAGFQWKDFGYLILSSLVPTQVFEMATLEGSLIALFAGTMLMVMCHMLFETARWVVPPGIWAALRPGNPRGTESVTRRLPK